MTVATPTFAERAAGAVLGGLIGEALGVGPHWYYDLEELRRDHGDWIDGYVDPKPGRYHDGLKAGQLSQAGIIAEMLLDSVLAEGGYSEAAFAAKLDGELFPQLNGDPRVGPGGYTSQSIREAWRKRVGEGLPWGQVAGYADTTEGAERIFVLAALLAADPSAAAIACRDNTRLTQIDTTTVAITTAFGAVVSALVRGEPLDEGLGHRLMELVHAGRLPFHHVTNAGTRPPEEGQKEQPLGTNFPSPDALFIVGSAARAAKDPGVVIEPAWKASIVFGMPCALYYQMPAAYYLAARFAGDFEGAVLNAVNGGGQNQARAMLTGVLAGAMVGIGGIPQRFIDGLEDGAARRGKALALGRMAEALAAVAGDAAQDGV